MRQRRIQQKMRSMGAFLLILILLPYVATVLIHGVDRRSLTENRDCYVNVKIDGENGNELRAVPWQEYFLGVLALELPEKKETDFCKAQAVLIRTKLYEELNRKRTAGEDLILTDRYLSMEELEQKGGEDYKTYYKELRRAMEETENQVLFYQGTYAWTPFHQSSSGMTRSAQEVTGEENFPYLAVRECPLDKEANDEMQILELPYKEVQTKCQPFLVAVEEEQAGKTYTFPDFEILSYDSAGYVTELRIGETVCTGDQFRDALSLSSSAFSLQEGEEGLKITTMGNGHGLGMSQWTANEMAKEGKMYEEILQFFFEGTELADGGDVETMVHPGEASEK